MIREDRHLFIIARRNKDTTTSQISHKLYASAGNRISKVTVSRRLYETELFAGRLVLCVPLSFVNRRIRLNDAEIIKNGWPFSLLMSPVLRLTFIWRKPWMRFLYSNV
ncbi:transposable element Tc1 transposase [Trichonephila clavipes]|nr:transposable element Tc1 transposase [Trichonephila clavipes]